jgi:type II secretory pathway pseudopilin PulG
MNRKNAFSLLELIVVTALGAFLAIITGVSLRSASKIFTSVSGRDSAQRNVLKARRILENDLILASLGANRLAIEKTPASLGGGADGDAVNFLSAVNTTTQEVAILDDGSGSPYYFMNVYYYITVPLNHDALFGITCTGGNEAGGYDFNCPHKILLRGTSDQNPAYDVTDSASQDVLISPLSALLTRPTGFPRGANLFTVAANLLTFQVTRQNQELIVDLRAVAIQDAQTRASIGSTSFRSSGYTVTQRFSVFPKN